MQSELCAVCPAVYIQCAAEYAVCVFGVLHMMFAWCALCSVCRDCPAVYIHCFQCVFLLFSVECVRVQCGAHTSLQCLFILPCSKITVSSVCVQCGAHGVRASLDPSWFFVGRRTFTSGIWRMGRGNTDRHAHTNRQMNTHEPNTVGRSEKHTKTDEPAHMSAKSN